MLKVTNAHSASAVSKAATPFISSMLAEWFDNHRLSI
jgi:hypothetical protein